MPAKDFRLGRSVVSARSRPLAPVTAGLLLAAIVATIMAAGGRSWGADAAGAAASEQRLADAIRYLADDALEGRGVGTAGLDKAAAYLAEQFAALGLNTKVYDGTPFQKFKMLSSMELGEVNQLSLQPSAGETLTLKFGEEFTPLSIGGSGKLDLPLVFAGYGITAKDKEYDDYAGIDVEGKAVVILRRLPQEDQPHKKLGSVEHSRFAPMWRKVSNAYEHGAAAVIFCSPEAEMRKRIDSRRPQLQAAIAALTQAQADFQKIEKPTLAQAQEYHERLAPLLEAVETQSKNLASELDALAPFQISDGPGESARIPVVHVRREAIDRMLKAALSTDLATLEKEIDAGPTPHSREIPGWRLTGEVNVLRRETEVKNVVAVLEGEGPHADETIVIGAHYDHLGLGGSGSFIRGKEIHNGADDNGSGTAALVEVARIMATSGKKLSRRVVFIAFTGEERGLIGSARYCKEPLYPLDKTVAMLNMDMVGRLKDEKLIIQGVNTAPEFSPIIEKLNESYGFDLKQKDGGTGPSDHSSFYAHKIPVMHFFTGLHSDYHRPSDDFDKVNVPGMRRVAEMVAETALALAAADTRPTYVEIASSEKSAGGDGERPYFGSIPDFGQEQPGYAISGATKDSPADKAGMKGGDIIIKFGESKIGNLEDFDSALRKYKSGDKVPVIVKRGNEEVKLEVTLAPPR